MDMETSRHRRNAAITRSMRFRLLPSVVVVCGLMLGFGLIVATHWDAPMESCLAWYEQARTAADSARVDHAGKSLRNRRTCGKMRRNGTLDRHRQWEARRAAARAASGPLIEK